jgi:hypothetical protein
MGTHDSVLKAKKVKSSQFPARLLADKRKGR